MECERCNSKLSALVDGALSARDAERLREHVAGCRRCREDLAELQSLRLLLRNMSTPQPRPEFWDNAYRTVRLQARPRRRFAVRLPSLGHVHGWAAVCGVFVGALLLSAPKHLNQVAVPEQTVNPAALISIHAVSHAGAPLSDPGTVRYALTEAHAADLSDDQQMDAD